MDNSFFDRLRLRISRVIVQFGFCDLSELRRLCRRPTRLVGLVQGQSASNFAPVYLRKSVVRAFDPLGFMERIFATVGDGIRRYLIYRYCPFLLAVQQPAIMVAIVLQLQLLFERERSAMGNGDQQPIIIHIIQVC